MFNRVLQCPSLFSSVTISFFAVSLDLYYGVFVMILFFRVTERCFNIVGYFLAILTVLSFHYIRGFIVLNCSNITPASHISTTAIAAAIVLAWFSLDLVNLCCQLFFMNFVRYWKDFFSVSVDLPHGRPRPTWLVDAQSTVSSITGDQQIKRPQRPRNPARPDSALTPGGFENAAGPVGGLDLVSGIGLSDGDDRPGKIGGVDRSDEIEEPPGSRQSDSSTSTTTTLRPPPWLKTNVTKNVTTTTTTSSTTTSTTTSTPTPQSAPTSEDSNPGSADSASSPSSSLLHRPSYGGLAPDQNMEDIEEEEERSLEREEDRERMAIIEEQNKLLEEELNQSFPPKQPSGPVRDDSSTAIAGNL